MASARPRGRPRHDDVLTPAEWRVVNAVRHGMSNRIAARQLKISLETVKFHVENAVAKLGLSGRAELKRWQGAPVDSAMNGRGPVVTTSVEIGRLHQVSREVKDLKQATAWFRDVLRLPLVGEYGNLAMFDMQGVNLFLGHHDDGYNAGNSVLYFGVDDINAAYTDLAARGIEFEGAPHMINRADDGTETWMAFFKDMDGHPLSIVSEVSPKQSGGDSDGRP